MVGEFTQSPQRGLDRLIHQCKWRVRRRIEERRKDTTMNDHQDTPKPTLPHLPDRETILAELAKAKSIDDLTGKDGVFARLFGKTLTAMLEGEMSAHLGYEPYEAKGRNSGNSRNGKRERQGRTSSGGGGGAGAA